MSHQKKSGENDFKRQREAAGETLKGEYIVLALTLTKAQQVLSFFSLRLTNNDVLFCGLHPSM